MCLVPIQSWHIVALGTGEFLCHLPGSGRGGGSGPGLVTAGWRGNILGTTAMFGVRR